MISSASDSWLESTGRHAVKAVIASARCWWVVVRSCGFIATIFHSQVAIAIRFFAL